VISKPHLSNSPLTKKEEHHWRALVRTEIPKIGTCMREFDSAHFLDFSSQPPKKG
jgi:hypothetical protein